MERINMFKLLVLLVVTLSTLWCASALGWWQENGIPICTADSNQTLTSVTPDGAGGAIIGWDDYRSGNVHFYVQRVDASGNVMWGANGVTSNDWTYTELTSDGTGGAIITWESNSGDIYVQRVDASGSLLWGVHGVAVCTAPYEKYPPVLTSDRAGGAIITWWDFRNGSDSDIYAQRVDASGNTLWPSNGVGICTAAGDQFNQEITSDGAGGAIITWQDWGEDCCDLYVQRVNAVGVVKWAANGVAICTAAGAQAWPLLISDGAGGAIITWWDERSGSRDIYAQRVDTSGNVKWAANGVAICTAAGDQWEYDITSDGAGGAIITWGDDRSGSYDVYAQRVDASGNVKWAVDGVAICTTLGYQGGGGVTSDGAGGAIITCCDNPSGNYDVYAQRVDASWNVKWAVGGIAVCTAAGDQQSPQITSDGAGGAIIIWQDYRSGNSDIYAQRVPAGIVDVPLTATAVSVLSQNVPNPFNPLTRITFSVNVPGEVRLRICDIAGRCVRTLVDAWREPGAYTEVWDGKTDDGSALPSGVYFYSLIAGDFVATRKMVLLR